MIVVVGSMNADLSVRASRLPLPGETVIGSDIDVRPGGKSSNQAAAAARLGATVAMVGAVGDDQYAKILLDSAAAAGVGISDVVTLPGAATGTAMIVVDAAAENTIVVSPGANDQLRPEDLPERLVSDASVLCLALETPIETVLRAAEIAEEAGTTVVLNLSPYREVPPELLRATTVLVVNEHELACLSGASEDVVDGEVAQRVLAAIGITNAVVTLGADGALVVTPGGVTHLAAPRVEAVDTTGSGDAFTGALATGLAEGRSLTDAARLGNATGAYAATRAGAQTSYPSRREAEELLRSAMQASRPA
ncbi:ribokinase [Promicromonospora umidemergens]|uniref:Ribokinase n=2 Tax=Promicromonospora umidemergens TaxID=629679 RepID=A0ABP8WXV3_9MICO